MLYIFDLDGTTVDSSHRLGRGSLESWKRTTRQKTLPRMVCCHWLNWFIC